MMNADKIDLNYGNIGKPFFAYLIDFFRDMSCLARVLSNHFWESQQEVHILNGKWQTD